MAEVLQRLTGIEDREDGIPTLAVEVESNRIRESDRLARIRLASSSRSRTSASRGSSSIGPSPPGRSSGIARETMERASGPTFGDGRRRRSAELQGRRPQRQAASGGGSLSTNGRRDGVPRVARPCAVLADAQGGLRPPPPVEDSTPIPPSGAEHDGTGGRARRGSTPRTRARVASRPARDDAPRRRDARGSPRRAGSPTGRRGRPSSSVSTAGPAATRSVEA